MSDHLIHRLTFEIGNLRDNKEYQRIASGIFSIVNTTLKLRLETILDRYDFHDYHIVINSIEIDLGEFSPRNYQNELLDRVVKYLDQRFDKIERIIEASIKEEAYLKETDINELSGLNPISILKKGETTPKTTERYVQSEYVSNISLKENQYLEAVSFYLLNGWLPYYLNIPQKLFAQHFLSTISNNMGVIASFISKQSIQKQKQIQSRLSQFVFSNNDEVAKQLTTKEKKKLLESNKDVELLTNNVLRNTDAVASESNFEDLLINKVLRNADAVAFESKFKENPLDKALKDTLLNDALKPFYTSVKSDNLGLLIRVFVEYIETGKTVTNILPYYISNISEVINQLYKRAPVILKEIFTRTNIFKQPEHIVQSRIVHLYSQLRKTHVNFLLQAHISNAQKWQKPLNALNEIFESNVEFIPDWLKPIKDNRRAHAFLFYNLVQKENNLGAPMVDFAKDLLLKEAVVFQQPKTIRNSFEKVFHYFTSKDSYSSNELKSVIRNIDRLYKANKSSLVTIFEEMKKSGLKENEIQARLVSLAEYASVDVLDKVLSVFYGDSNVVKHSEMSTYSEAWTSNMDVEKRIRIQLLFDTINNNSSSSATYTLVKRFDPITNYLKRVAVKDGTTQQSSYILFSDWIQKNERYLVTLSQSQTKEKLNLTVFAESLVTISTNIVRINQELKNLESTKISESIKRNIEDLVLFFEKEIKSNESTDIVRTTSDVIEYFDNVRMTKKGLTVEFVETFLQYKGQKDQIDAMDTIVSSKELVKDSKSLGNQLISEYQVLSLKRIKQILDFGKIISEKSIQENYYKNTSKSIMKWVKDNEHRIDSLNELETHLEKGRNYSAEEIKLIEYVKQVKQELENETEEDSIEVAVTKLITNLESYYIPRTGNKNNTFEKIVEIIPENHANQELSQLVKKLTDKQIIDNPSLRKLEKKTFEKLLQLLLPTDTFRTFIKWRERYKKMLRFFASEFEINTVLLALTTNLRNLNEENLVVLFLNQFQGLKGWTNYKLKTESIRFYEEFSEELSDVQRETYRKFVSEISTAENVQDSVLMQGLDQGIAIKNAGLVLLWPFMKILFKLAGLMSDKGEFHDKESKQRAVFLLQYLAVKQSEGDEPYIVFNKIFVGLELDDPMPTGITLTDKEKDICDSLLMNTIKQWTALGKSSPDNLRGTFIIRDGVLHFREGAWHLVVESKSFDLLLGKLPWSYSMIRASWLPYVITVDWN